MALVAEESSNAFSMWIKEAPNPSSNPVKFENLRYLYIFMRGDDNFISWLHHLPQRYRQYLRVVTFVIICYDDRIRWKTGKGEIFSDLVPLLQQQGFLLPEWCSLAAALRRRREQLLLDLHHVGRFLFIKLIAIIIFSIKLIAMI